MKATVDRVPVLILCPHSRCNCRCIMCDIWKDSTKAEISTSELHRHLFDIERLGVEWIVLSGGEPLMHSDLFRLSAMLRKRNIRITLLSTGLLLERNANRIVEHIDEIIVSLDGPPDVHDRIRRVNGAFSNMQSGIQMIHSLRPSMSISARCTVQRQNHFCLRQTARAAMRMGVRSISFLAADLTSEAFNRASGWSAEHQARIALTEDELPTLETEIQKLHAEFEGSGFVVENAEKLARIVHHYRAHLGLCDPISPRCNAPWVSAVIEADGTVRPCFFHKSIGNLNGTGLLKVLNGPEAQVFRHTLDIASNPVCRRCVCSLNWRREPEWARPDNIIAPHLQEFYTNNTT